MFDLIVIIAVLYLVGSNDAAAPPSAPSSVATPVQGPVALVPSYANAGVVDISTVVQAAPVALLPTTSYDLTEVTPPAIVAAAQSSQTPISNPATALMIPVGPPPIPTESSAYSYNNGYRGWTLALARQNVDAIATLSNADRADPEAAQAILKDPNVAKNTGNQNIGGDPSLSAYSLYYSPNQFNPYYQGASN